MKTGKEDVVEEVPCVFLAEIMEVGGSIGWAGGLDREGSCLVIFGRLN